VRQHSRAKLLVAGFPTKHINMNDLLGLAAMLGISDAVIFDTRYIPFEEVGSLMRLATVAVYPYRNGTQSAALQVAYTFGRPVIATDVGGLSDEVEVGRSGLLVSPESPEELAMAILKIVNDPQLAAQMGAYARCLSETRYAWMAIAGQILEVYHSLSDAMEL
jgi:D-inositol-3-phosphate glycosyltransferase